MRKPLSLLILSCLACGLAACASPEEQRQADAAVCRSYGFAPETPDFAACLQREQLSRNNSSSTSVGVGVGSGGYRGGGFGGVGMGFGF